MQLKVRPIIKGDPFVFDLSFGGPGSAALDLTGAELKCEIRQQIGSPVLATALTSDGTLVAVAAKVIGLRLTAAQTAAFRIGTVVFDVIRIDGGQPSRLPFMATWPVTAGVTAR